MSEEEREEDFRNSCNGSDNYPKCLINPTTQEYNLKSYHERLDDESSRLFCSDLKADVDIWEYVDFSSDFQLARMHSSFEIRGHFEGEHLFDEADPICRYLFISAPNSRSILRISRKILNYILTYYQVMPAFLDFIFQFGLQEYAQDFHFSGFREETHLLDSEKSLQIKKLGRSGREICMCYSLKSVERLDGDNWPWSIRQTAAYHSFDVETGRAFWILVKANEVIEERVQASTSPDRLARHGSLEEAWRSFTSTLETHLILCDWSAENWRWYIKFLEEVLQDATSRTLGIRIGIVSKLSKPEETFKATARRTLSTAATVEKGFHQGLSPPSQVPFYQQTQALPGDPPPKPPVLPPSMRRQSLEKDKKLGGHQDFTFHDLQQVQSLEEKTNEILLVLDSNVNIMTELKEYYQSVINSNEWPKELLSAGRDSLRFSKRIARTITELQMHRARTETLLRLLSERKNLLYGILQYHNMEANNRFTRKAQESADRMEKITNEMHEIAKKTKQETVSMKIITVVTLFFLPGTFMSTIMSTDIIRWQSDAAGQTQRVYQSGALNLYLEITIPLMIVTFGAWRAVYVWMRWMEQRDADKAENEIKA